LPGFVIESPTDTRDTLFLICTQFAKVRASRYRLALHPRTATLAERGGDSGLLKPAPLCYCLARHAHPPRIAL
jgi:hypothetical protein